jgi:hypothetical protein
MWDFVMDKSGAGAGFLRELRFLLPMYIPSTSPQSSSLSPEAGTIGQEWPQCQKPHKRNKKKKRKIDLHYVMGRISNREIFFRKFMEFSTSSIYGNYIGEWEISLVYLRCIQV